MFRARAFRTQSLRCEIGPRDAHSSKNQPKRVGNDRERSGLKLATFAPLCRPAPDVACAGGKPLSFKAKVAKISVTVTVEVSKATITGSRVTFFIFSKKHRWCLGFWLEPRGESS